MCWEVEKDEKKWIEWIITPKQPRQTGKDSNSLSKGPKADLLVAIVTRIHQDNRMTQG